VGVISLKELIIYYLNKNILIPFLLIINDIYNIIYSVHYTIHDIYIIYILYMLYIHRILCNNYIVLIILQIYKNI